MKKWVLLIFFVACCTYATNNQKLMGCENCDQMSNREYDHCPYFTTLRRTNTHTIAKVLVPGKRFQLEDGSVFDVVSEAHFSALSWQPYSMVRIKPGKTRHRFRLVNMHNQQTVEGTIALEGPAILNDLRRQIAQIDHSKLAVRLDDFSSFSATAETRETFETWKLKDQILVGDNEDNKLFPYILINVTNKNYIPAHRENKK